MPVLAGSWVEVVLRVDHRPWSNSLIRMRDGESPGDVFTIASLEKTGHAACHRLGDPPHDATVVALVSTSFADRDWTRAIPAVHTRQYGL
jgi:hypothetical protein